MCPAGCRYGQDKTAGISEKVIRLLETFTLIAQKQYPSVSSLMERFDISKRSVFRYLEIIGSALNAHKDKQ